MSISNLAAGLPPFLSARALLHSPYARAIKSFRAALGAIAARRRRRRERQELLEFLASDHRIAADIGYRHQRE